MYPESRDEFNRTIYERILPKSDPNPRNLATYENPEKPGYHIRVGFDNRRFWWGKSPRGLRFPCVSIDDHDRSNPAGQLVSTPNGWRPRAVVTPTEELFIYHSWYIFNGIGQSYRYDDAQNLFCFAESIDEKLRWYQVEHSAEFVDYIPEETSTYSPLDPGDYEKVLMLISNLESGLFVRVL